MRVGRFLIGLTVLLLAWSAATLFVPPRLLPSPVQTLRLLAHLLPGALGLHALASLARSLAAMAAATALAVPLGLLIGRSRLADDLVAPLVYVLYPVPKIALLPLIMLYLGIGDLARITVVGLVIYFQMVIQVRDAARAVADEHLATIRALGGGPRHLLLDVLLPGVLPALFSSLRLAAGTSLAVLFFAETFFTRWGLGWFIMDAWSRIDYPRLFAGIIAMGGSGSLLLVFIDLAERLACPWTTEGRSR